MLVLYTKRNTFQKISVNSLSLGHNDIIPSMGIEPATLRSLTRLESLLDDHKLAATNIVSSSESKMVFLPKKLQMLQIAD